MAYYFLKMEHLAIAFINDTLQKKSYICSLQELHLFLCDCFLLVFHILLWIAVCQVEQKALQNKHGAVFTDFKQAMKKSNQDHINMLFEQFS